MGSLCKKIWYWLIMPKYGNSALGPPKMEFFKIFSLLWKDLKISLPTSPQPPPDINFKSSYARKRDYAQIWKFSPRLPKMEFFKIFSFSWKSLQISLLTSPQPPPGIKSKSSYARKRDYAQKWKFSPRLPKMKFSKKFIFLKRSPDFTSNEPSTPPQTLSLSQVMQENVILAYHAQIWKFGLRLPKMEFFKKLSFFWKVFKFRF